jgi:GWxTD domain-containing protein
MQLKPLLVLASIGFFMFASPGPASNPLLASSGSPETKTALRRTAAAHPDSARIQARLAAIYFAEGTVEGRALAAKHLNLALRKDPDNVAYRLLLAEVWFEATFWRRGVGELETILARDPGNCDARFRLGCAYLERAVEEWQEESFIRARRELSLVDSRHNAWCRARRKLALCLFDMGKPDSSVALLEALPGDSLDTEALLVMGMALNEMKDLEGADSAFKRALSGMDDAERHRYVSADLVGGTEPAVSDSLLDLFWRKRDPDLATPCNERLVEHLARVAFADLHFSVPRLDRPGSLTTRGEVFIRYGRPTAWFFDPFGSGIFADETVMPLMEPTGPAGSPGAGYAEEAGRRHGRMRLRVDKPRWIWTYPGFTLDFEDVFLNGDYTFPYERDWSAYTYAYLEREIPEIYETRIKKNMHVVMDALNRLDNLGRPSLRLVYACDTRGVNYQPDYEWPEADYQVRIALMDTNYTDVIRSNFAVRLAADSGAIYRTTYPMIATTDLSAPPGSLIAAVSISSEANGAVGFTSHPVEIRRFGRGLEVSDIELRFKDRGPANPSHVYLRRGFAHIAFDIYNLALDARGTGRAEVAYRITRRRESESAVMRLIKYLGLAPSERFSTGMASVESKYELRSVGPNRFETIGVDLAPLAMGDYDIEVKVKDLVSGEDRTVTTTLRIASEVLP